jgi:hypothetical protein
MYAPACTGNTRTSAEITCQNASTACPNAAQGYIAYWRWTAVFDRGTNNVVQDWAQDPGTFCMTAGQDGVPLTPSIVGIVSNDFQRLVVLKGIAHVDPDGATLVNYQNGFWTEAGRYVLDPIQVLGHRVVVTAEPEKYDWYFGDGTSAMNAGPGRHGALDVSHTYASKGAVQPYVVITWSGTFTIDGGAPLDVIGTAITTGNGTPLQVKEAKAQLVSR